MLLKFCGRAITQRRMQPFPIVSPVDERHRRARYAAVREQRCAVEQLPLQRCEEALDDRVVSTIPPRLMLTVMPRVAKVSRYA